MSCFVHIIVCRVAMTAYDEWGFELVGILKQPADPHNKGN